MLNEEFAVFFFSYYHRVVLFLYIETKILHT